MRKDLRLALSPGKNPPKELGSYTPNRGRLVDFDGHLGAGPQLNLVALSRSASRPSSGKMWVETDLNKPV